MRKELAKAIKHPVLFLDDWPQPPKGAEEEEEFETPGLTDVKRWRLQMLLAANPWGVPSLAFSQAYEKMFARQLDIKDLGFEDLSDMVANLPDVFTIQEADDTTALMFPDYPQDRILHDARIGHSFQHQRSSNGQNDYKTTDPDTLIAYAWLNRDDDFPNNVVLAGEQYSELILPMTSANIPGTRGVHQAVMVGAANPSRFFINIKNAFLERLVKLSADIALYFKECGQRIEMFSVPEEFIYPGFPCLVYLKEEQGWERCSIVGRSGRGGKIVVESVDYGGNFSVNQIQLYLMPRKFFDIPRQGVAVSLIGLKPADGSDKWSTSVGTRMRCFSNFKYWLDCVLVEPKEPQKDPADIKSVSEITSVSSNDSGTGGSLIHKRRRRTQKSRPQFEVLVCDRNDDEMNLYLDEILLLETYAIFDDGRSQDVSKLRSQLDEALQNVPRPTNPLKNM